MLKPSALKWHCSALTELQNRHACRCPYRVLAAPSFIGLCRDNCLCIRHRLTVRWAWLYCTRASMTGPVSRLVTLRKMQCFVISGTSFLSVWLTEQAVLRPPQYSPPLQVDLWPFDLESGVRITCDVGYLCANFSLPRPLCSRLMPDVRDRQTSDVVRRASSLNATYGGGRNKQYTAATVYQCRIFLNCRIFHALHNCKRRHRELKLILNKMSSVSVVPFHLRAIHPGAGVYVTFRLIRPGLAYSLCIHSVWIPLLHPPRRFCLHRRFF